ncbi:MAG TPA: hypothetical protein VKR32_10575 [Puia sp.]|nr:hypothetical protein [Puia sp.]
MNQVLPGAISNDLVACKLLKKIDRYEQFAIMYPIDTGLLNRLMEVAVLNEEYEICQVIKELLDERKITG